ncbi:Sua5/YciO/YrdC/YwlC family protein [Alloprevotella rava F0323]|uniref:Sua5/YciO/YrdC/YwlC family protein n=2 Tax=Alloprevotella rava TaxID=671218 RepID=G5G9F2_9BACT|nr:Sua5/YciO/YrdC/YwlC family protein [Alloprevotella rava F0323]
MLRLYSSHNDISRLQQIIDVLNDGGVIIYPTDTTYALGCNALKERAVERICRIRNIDLRSHPLSIICYDMGNISEYAHISTPVFKLMKRNLPGPFTFILSGTNRLPKIFRVRRQKEVGIRMPDNPITNQLVEMLGVPLLTASLPVEDMDREYATNPELIEEHFGSDVDLVIDGGEGIDGESTIVDCLDEDPKILRQGLGLLK